MMLGSQQCKKGNKKWYWADAEQKIHGPYINKESASKASAKYTAIRWNLKKRLETLKKKKEGKA